MKLRRPPPDVRFTPECVAKPPGNWAAKLVFSFASLDLFEENRRTTVKPHMLEAVVGYYRGISRAVSGSVPLRSVRLRLWRRLDHVIEADRA